jgi:hypothetical protein
MPGMGRLTRIHINQHVIRRNKATGAAEAPITVKTSEGNTYCQQVEVLGPCRVVYSPDKPLSCGARVWIETTSPVVTFGAVAPPPQSGGS